MCILRFFYSSIILYYDYQMKKVKIALALSDLVIYTKSEKFVSFEHSQNHQKCYENNSIGEVRARKFVKHSGNFF